MREEMSIPWGPFLAAQPCRDAGPGLLLPPGAPWWAPAPTASRRVAAAKASSILIPACGSKTKPGFH